MHFPTRSPRRLIGAAAIACATALIPAAALAATSSPAAPAAAASAPRCATSGLVVWMDTFGNGAAGTIYYTLEFTNLSGHACTLHGSPGVSAVSLSGRQLGSPAGGNYSGDTPAIILASGATAYAQLRYSDVITGNNFCKTVAAGLRVYPPNQFASKVIPYPIAACTRSGLVYMNVGPVQATPPPGSTL
jgi:Protein of unknown function (DUF4232)